MQSSSPSILVLATGGTISGQAGSATRADYRPGQIDIADFLAGMTDRFAVSEYARLFGRGAVPHVLLHV